MNKMDNLEKKLNDKKIRKLESDLNAAMKNYMDYLGIVSYKYALMLDDEKILRANIDILDKEEWEKSDDCKEFKDIFIK